MKKIVIQVERLEDGFKRFKKALQTSEPPSEIITFESVQSMFQTLTIKRWELVSALQKHGPMSL